MSEMTPKDRMRLSLEGGRPDRVPCYYMGTPAVTRRVADELGMKPESEVSENRVARALGADIVFVRPVFRGETGGIDGFPIGDVHAKIHGERGGVHSVQGALAGVIEPLRIHEADCWPDPEHYEYEIDEELASACESHYTVARGMGALFLAAMSLRGMEEFLVDMVVHPAMCHEILGRIAEYHAERIERYLSANAHLIDMVDIGDDVAGQNGMLFSLSMWREYMKPHLRRLVSIIHRYGKKSLFFGCGGFRPIMGDLIEIGMDSAGRLQTEARDNDFTRLKHDFGRRIGLWGALDAQHALIEGTPSSVERHVTDVVTIGSAGGMFVAGPTHTFTQDTTVENVLTTYRTLGCRPPDDRPA